MLLMGKVIWSKYEMTKRATIIFLLNCLCLQYILICTTPNQLILNLEDKTLFAFDYEVEREFSALDNLFTMDNHNLQWRAGAKVVAFIELVS